MLTKTTLKHPALLKKVKEAILDAVRRASVHPTGIVVVDVYNRKDQVLLSAVGIRGRSYRVTDYDGNDVTSLVNDALKDYHSEGNK